MDLFTAVAASARAALSLITSSAYRGVACAVMPQKSTALDCLRNCQRASNGSAPAGLAALRIVVFHATGIGNGVASEIVGADRHFAVPAWNVEHVCGLCKARDAPAQSPHQALAFGDRGAEMTGTGCRIEVVQVVGFYAQCHEGAHELRQRLGIVVDALEQHGLGEHGNAGVDEACTRAPRSIRELARVIAMEHDVDGFRRRLERPNEFGRDTPRIGDWNPRVPAQHRHVLNRAQPLADLSDAPWRKHEWIAAR